MGSPSASTPSWPTPANDAKSVVAGDFRSAYVVRLLPVRIETDADSASANDNVRVRIVLRADGTRQVTDACRALVHPAA